MDEREKIIKQLHLVVRNLLEKNKNIKDSFHAVRNLFHEFEYYILDRIDEYSDTASGRIMEVDLLREIHQEFIKRILEDTRFYG